MRHHAATRCCRSSARQAGKGSESRDANPRPAPLAPTKSRGVPAAPGEHADEIMDRVLDIVRNGSDADARAALKDWMDCVYGRPVQPTEDLTGSYYDDQREWEEMTDEEQEAALDEARRRWQASKGA